MGSLLKSGARIIKRLDLEMQIFKYECKLNNGLGAFSKGKAEQNKVSDRNRSPPTKRQSPTPVRRNPSPRGSHRGMWKQNSIAINWKMNASRNSQPIKSPPHSS